MKKWITESPNRKFPLLFRYITMRRFWNNLFVPPSAKPMPILRSSWWTIAPPTPPYSRYWTNSAHIRMSVCIGTIKIKGFPGHRISLSSTLRGTLLHFLIVTTYLNRLRLSCHWFIGPRRRNIHSPTEYTLMSIRAR